MGLQRKTSVDVHQPGPRWLHLTSVFLVWSLVLPALSLQSLQCYFCPMQEKSLSCPNISSECLPTQRCSSSTGRYGSVHILSAQGCVDADLCDSHQIISYRGVEYNVSHSCCCKDGCNTAPTSGNSLKKLLGMIGGETDNATHVTGDSDSCANYTLTAAFPAMKT